MEEKNINPLVIYNPPRIFNAVRLFNCRPSALSFPATGTDEPYPL
jgi:hypothetical protein